MIEKSNYRGDKVYMEELESGVEVRDEVCFDREIYFEHSAKFSHLERIEALVLNITFEGLTRKCVYTLRKKTGGILFVKETNLFKNRLYRRILNEEERLMKELEKQEKEKPARKKAS